METAIDLEHLRQWIGRTRSDTDVVALRHARLMAATVDRPGTLQPGDPLPPLWHWIYFLEGLPRSNLGRDGHPARGDFLPPVPLPNRMWAGGRVQFDAPLPIGAAVEKRSQVKSIEHKHGRSGDLVFVTVQHEVHAGDVRCIREEHDIVYRNPLPHGQPARADAAPAATAPAVGTLHRRDWTPDSTQLFRYSALTFNGHRIHYDADYCRNVEGYPNLVIHGPLIATMVAGLAVDAAGRPISSFNYRAVSPSLLGATLALEARIDGNRLSLTATLPTGVVAMRADATA
jgi:3-methylfumaryl-CoA hydratase